MTKLPASVTILACSIVVCQFAGEGRAQRERGKPAPAPESSPARNTPAGSPSDGISHGCRAIRFEGVGERVVIPHSKALCSSGPLTIEMWVRPLRAVVNPPWHPNLIGKRRTNRRYPAWALGLGPELEPYTVANSAWLYDDRTLQIEEWSHIAVVFDGRQVRFFINGRPGRSHPATTQGPPNGEPVIMGTLLGNTQNFAGDIASVRVSRSARYKDVFDPDVYWAPDKSTVLLMNFRGKDERVLDDSGLGNHGLVEGVVERLDAPRPSGSPGQVPGGPLRSSDAPAKTNTPPDLQNDMHNTTDAGDG